MSYASLAYRLPRPLRRHILYFESQIEDAVAAFARALPAEARVLDAGSGQGQYRHRFARQRYCGVDLAVGDAAWDAISGGRACLAAKLHLRWRRRSDGDDRGAAEMSGTAQRVILTRRRGDAEEDAENAFEKEKAERTQRKRRDVGWRHRPGTQLGAHAPECGQDGPSIVTNSSLRSPGISADSALGGFDLLLCVLRVFLRVSASPRQEYGLLGSGSTELRNGAMP
jgi:SAM-dependent methyltransferase